jgi:ABC-type bacteriocin/lantibiotic exporter with double-glycine peptidase domain
MKRKAFSITVAGLLMCAVTVHAQSGDGADLTIENNDNLCGPIVLYQVEKLFNRPLIPISQLISYCKTDLLRGTSLEGMVEGARQVGIGASLCKCNLAALRADPRVAVVLFDTGRGKDSTGHFVLIDEIADEEISIIDGAHRKILTIRDFRRLWTGYTIFYGASDRSMRHDLHQYMTAAGSALCTMAIIAGFSKTVPKRGRA